MLADDGRRVGGCEDVTGEPEKPGPKKGRGKK